MNVFYFILEYSQFNNTVIFQVDSKGTQTHIYMYPFSPKFASHPGCQMTLSRVLCVYSRTLLVSILNILEGTFQSQTPNFYCSIFPLATTSSFSKSVSQTFEENFVFPLSFMLHGKLTTNGPWGMSEDGGNVPRVG